MYAIKIFHGYLSTDGKRTLDERKAKLYEKKEKAEQFAFIVGGRVKKLEQTA